MPPVLLVKSASTNKRGEASSGPHAHRLDEATDMGDPFVELAAEIEHLVGEAKAQVIRAEDMELLAQRRQVVFPGEFGAFQRSRGHGEPCARSAPRPIWPLRILFRRLHLLYYGCPQQSGETCSRIEARPAQPVDRTVAAHQSRCFAVADQRIVFDP